MLRNVVTGGTLFNELGFYYIGPINGHDVNNLVTILENVKNSNHNGPILIHVITQKDKGYKPAEESSDKYHGVSTFNVITGKQSKSKSNALSYTKVFANTLIRHAENDTKIVLQHHEQLDRMLSVKKSNKLLQMVYIPLLPNPLQR